MNKTSPEKLKNVIIGVVCSFYGISPEDIVSKNRQGKIPEARKVCADALYRVAKLSKCDVSREMGQSKHWYCENVSRNRAKQSKHDNNLQYCIRKVLETLETLENTKHEYFTHETITDGVCGEFRVTKDDLAGMVKSGNIANARCGWCYLLFKHHTTNHKEIGQIMNRKSHSSAHDYLERAEGLMQTDKLFRERIENIQRRLSSPFLSDNGESKNL